eukprot:2806259-Pyramimonas_sp.AAC.1
MVQGALACLAQLAEVALGQPVFLKASLSPGTESKRISHARFVMRTPDLTAPVSQKLSDPLPQNRPAPDPAMLRSEEDGPFISPVSCTALRKTADHNRR